MCLFSKYKTQESVRIFFQIPIETASKYYPQKLENKQTNKQKSCSGQPKSISVLSRLLNLC